MQLQTPKFVTKVLKNFTWRISDVENKLYLTFDDGPIPEFTPWILNELKKANAKCTFFCVGENVKKYPLLFKQIIDDGHTVGNQTFNHLNGWKTDIYRYLQNVNEAQKYIDSKLFRPPYGKLKPSQTKVLKKDFKLIMWDVLSRDFDQKITKEQCLNNVIKYSKSGSIIVFHDSLKTIDNLTYVLPKVLDYYSKINYKFCSIK